MTKNDFDESLGMDEMRDSPETLSFKTYKNYLVAISGLIESKYGKNPLVNLKKTMNEICQKIERNKRVDLKKIRSLLINCWHTELNFLLPTKIGGDFTKYSMHWAPVQAYYSAYLSLRVLMESCNADIDNKHTPTLSTVSNWIVKRKLFPYPWNCYFHKITGYGEFKEKIKDTHNLYAPTPENFENLCAKFLKTTRKEKFEKRKSESKIRTKQDKLKKRYTKQDKEKIEKGLHATTLFDCLYRLRIKSNYGEVGTYALSDTGEKDIDVFYYSLKKILTGTLYILEFMVAKYIGPDKIKKIISKFKNNISKEDLKTEGIFERERYLQ